MKSDYETTIFEKEKETKKGNKFSCRISANRLAFGLLFIACAILIILDSVGVSLGFLSGIPAIKLIVGAMLAVWLISELIKLNISGIFFPVAFIFMLFEKYIAKWAGLEKSNIINNGLVVIAALLLTIGTDLITPRKKIFKINYGGEASKKKNAHNSALSSSTVYIDCSDFVYERVKNDLGACNVYFSNVEKYEGNGTLEIQNDLGATRIHVPSDWKIISSISNGLGAVSKPEDTGNGDKAIRIIGDNNLGAVSIVRV